MEALGGLFIIFVVARLFGEGAERCGQPAEVGELVAGVLLGLGLVYLAGFGISPHGLWAMDGELIELVAQAGIFFLLLAAGIDMQPRSLMRNGGAGFGIALGGAIVPLVAGVWLAWEFLPPSDSKAVQAGLVGVALAITAIPTTVRVLSELGLLSTRLGQAMVAAAIFDDVIGLILLALLTALIETGALPGLVDCLILVGKAAGFFVVTGLLGAHIYPRISRRLHVLQIASAELAILMAVAMGYGVLAELLGMHWIIGVFMAGLFFEPERVGHKAYNEMKLIVGGVTSGFAGPVFFASIGLAVDLTAAVHAPVFLAALIGLAVAGKLLGSGIPALFAGFSARDAATIGIGMSSRGAVELVIISIAMERGLFAIAGDNPVVAALPSALVLMAIATTLVAPVAMSVMLKGRTRRASS